MKIVRFADNFKGKTPILSKFWDQGSPLGSKLSWAPLTKILDPPLQPQPTSQGVAIPHFSVAYL